MTFDEIRNLLIAKFGDDAIVAEERTGTQPALVIKSEKLTQVCEELRDNEHTYFDFLSCLSGIDYGVDQNRFGVVYHLASIPYKSQLTLKVIGEFDRTQGRPVFPSVSNVWRTADWHEREAFDLVGIEFSNHADLRRILLPDDWDGHPLRKDYVAAEEYMGIRIN